MTGPNEQQARRGARETAAHQSANEVAVDLAVAEAALAETENGPASE